MANSHLPEVDHDQDCDLEKYDNEDDYEEESDPVDYNDAYYSISSRSTSGSHQPMLPQSPPRRRKSKVEHYRPPNRRTVQYLCLAVFTTLILFILFLVRASYVSQKQLEMGPVEKSTPARPPPWEDFPFLTRYFGGLRNLVPKEDNVPEFPSDEPIIPISASNATKKKRESGEVPQSKPFDPYPDYASSEYRAQYALKEECFLDAEEKVKIPRVRYYDGVPEGMPDPVIGAHNVFGLRDDTCFDRYGRLGPYGYGYSIKRGGSGAGMTGEREGADLLWTSEGRIPEVDFREVRWAEAQDACLEKNKLRFESMKAESDDRKHLFTKRHDGSELETATPSSIRKRDNTTVFSASENAEAAEYPMNLTLLPRTAIVIRTWWDHKYSTEDIIYLRSLIAELSLLSGAEYTVQFLIHVKDDDVPIWADKQIYDRVLENSLPAEFRGMGSLWSERQMGLIYGGLEESFFRELPVHGVYRGLYMALQYWSNQHPEYEYIWNWEMDVRYTGQWYHLFDRVQQWTKDQPRKGLWERNGRFYIPSVHGSWEDFKQMVRVQSEMGTDSPNNMWSGLKAGMGDIPGSPQAKSDKPVWGPEGPRDMLGAQDDPVPPVASPEKDHYEWGVGEEADLISFSPFFDPDGTTWFYVEDLSGYNTTKQLPPRRAAIGTSSRLSRRLLQTMHREMILARHHMFSEMWPASVALHHGYKAVYAPHPVYVDRRWPTAYLAGVMNGGRNGASGGARTSVYGGREHNFKGQTWFYDAGFSPNLWRRWLGYKVDNDGGEQEEIAGEGRMCLPAILLHPVKGVDMIVEGAKTIAEENKLEGTAKGVITDTDSDADAELDWEREG
ncbi:MAG: hypothetical protein OHK93_001749 [Ramalina farinacea]|uniref:Uncharacterized protein n=1 Tax=Ramalina farinacea TaxID=258253 RepID=A0AA43TY10_9LECA|nr:hypothetical protein [Ramalina farinacea]